MTKEAITDALFAKAKDNAEFRIDFDSDIPPFSQLPLWCGLLHTIQDLKYTTLIDCAHCMCEYWVKHNIKDEKTLAYIWEYTPVLGRNYKKDMETSIQKHIRSAYLSGYEMGVSKRSSGLKFMELIEADTIQEFLSDYTEGFEDGLNRRPNKLQGANA